MTATFNFASIKTSFDSILLAEHNASFNRRCKVSLAMHWDLAGVGVWTVSTDGRCGTEFPLLTTVNIALGKIAANNSTQSTFNISGEGCLYHKRCMYPIIKSF